MSNWNDDRLDQFERRVDERFNRIEEEMRNGFAEIRGAVLGLHRTLIASAIAIILALIGFHG